MSGHTELPWSTRGGHVYSANANVCSVSEPRGSDYVEYTRLELGSADLEEAYANADFIVTACNSHAELVKALEDLVEACDEPGLDDPKDPAYPDALDRQSRALQSAATVLATLTARKVG